MRSALNSYQMVTKIIGYQLKKLQNGGMILLIVYVRKGDKKMLWSIIWSILVGALIGWLAGIIMKSKGGFVRNAIMGILGGLVAGLLLPGWLGYVGSVIGACLVIWVYDKFIKK